MPIASKVWLEFGKIRK